VSPRISIALLTEDKSEQTWLGLKALVGRLLHRFEDDGFTQRIEIVPADDDVRPVVRANRWESTKRQDEAAKRLLWKYLAWKLSESGGFVVFHYDGDNLWGDRVKSPRPEKFARVVRVSVDRVLRDPKLRLSPEEIARRLQRIVECVPFYSVEAWLYQATDHAIALCREKYRGADVERFEKWGANRALLDDVHMPKEATCLKDKHNDELGKHVPVWEVVQAGRSLTCFVWALHACPELADALALPV
jgi:hypothetical protein